MQHLHIILMVGRGESVASLQARSLVVDIASSFIVLWIIQDQEALCQRLECQLDLLHACDEQGNTRLHCAVTVPPD